MENEYGPKPSRRLQNSFNISFVLPKAKKKKMDVSWNIDHFDVLFSYIFLDCLGQWRTFKIFWNKITDNILFKVLF